MYKALLVLLDIFESVQNHIILFTHAKAVLRKTTLANVLNIVVRIANHSFRIAIFFFSNCLSILLIDLHNYSFIFNFFFPFEFFNWKQCFMQWFPQYFLPFPISVLITDFFSVGNDFDLKCVYKKRKHNLNVQNKEKKHDLHWNPSMVLNLECVCVSVCMHVLFFFSFEHFIIYTMWCAKKWSRNLSRTHKIHRTFHHKVHRIIGISYFPSICASQL